MNKKPTIGYSLWREESSPYRERYQTLHLDIIHPEGCSDNIKARLQWQAHWSSHSSVDGKDTGPSEWYGLHFSCPDRADRIEYLALGVALLRKVEAALKRIQAEQNYPSYEPALLVRAMAFLKWGRYVYDKRRSRNYIPYDQVMPPEYKVWMVDFKHLGLDSNPFSFVLARNSEEATTEMVRTVMNSERGWYSADERLKTAAKWEAAGRPLEELTGEWYAPPVMKTTEELLLSPKAETEAKAEKVAQ